MDVDRQEKLQFALGIMLVSIIIAGSIDIYMDQPETWLSFHVAFEVMMVAGAAVMVSWIWLGWWHSSQSVEELRRSLEEKGAERDAWRARAQSALAEMGAALDRQFDSWRLTPAEREVALLLLKGHSHKAIAKLTGRSPQTVRQHAAVVYRKASLTGRAELSAFFLEDLVLPGSDGRELTPGDGDAPPLPEARAASP